MNLSKELKDKVEESVLNFICKAEETHGRTFRMPKIKYDLRGQCAGQAITNRYGATPIIRVHPNFLIENERNYLKNTIGHEVAHIVAFEYGARGHDHIWKKVMIKLGLPPTRCHSYTTANGAAGEVFEYVCGCDTEHNLTKRRHYKILRGASYTCRRCKQKLYWKLNKR